MANSRFDSKSLTSLLPPSIVLCSQFFFHDTYFVHRMALAIQSKPFFNSNISVWSGLTRPVH
ncbi:hypothetical protein JMJ77_0008890, partial [Colletotrichum scovillei]